MLKARGEDFFERIVDNLYDQAQYLVNLVTYNSQKNKQNLNYYSIINARSAPLTASALPSRATSGRTASTAARTDQTSASSTSPLP